MQALKKSIQNIRNNESGYLGELIFFPTTSIYLEKKVSASSCCPIYLSLGPSDHTCAGQRE